jgi:mono/diheme cytochrome c family protein
MTKIAAALCLVLLSACGQKPKVENAGRAYYEALNCRACHRIGADGSDGGPDLTLVGFRHSRLWLDTWLKSPQAWRPGTLMPSPELSEKAREAIADYLATLRGQDFASGLPWNSPELKDKPIGRGLLIYGRAGCIACHGKDGRGGYPNNNVKGSAIPALASVSQTYTKAELARKIKNGVTPAKADPAGPEPLVAMPKWGETLSDDDINAVVEYLFSLKPGTSSPGADF